MSACSARSTSSGLIIRSRSWRVSGPPRAQLARLPPSRNGMPASRSAAAARLSACSMSENGASSDPMSRWVPALTMTIHTTGRPPGEHESCRIRIAAAGDVHFGREEDRERAAAAFGSLEGRVDLVLLAGDLTTHGEPEQAAILAAAAGEL